MNMEVQAVKRRNACGILAAVLQQQKRIVETLIDGFVREKGNNAAHGWNLGREIRRACGKASARRMKVKLEA